MLFWAGFPTDLQLVILQQVVDAVNGQKFAGFA